MRRVLFLCVHNSCRSQMAEGFARAHGAGVLEAASAGTVPGGKVQPLAIEVMREKGIDISRHASKAIDPAQLARADTIITMGCKAEEACPAVFLPKVVDWGLEDPVGKPIGKFREVRDDIERRVRALVEEARREASKQA